MEVIKLETKKSIDWVHIILVSAGILAVLFLLCFTTIKYKYVIIEPNGTKYVVGVTNNTKLLDTVAIDYIAEIKEQGFQIASFNATKIYKRYPILTWRESSDEEEQITSAIKQDTEVIVYASKFTIDNNTFIVLDSKTKDIKAKLGSLDYSQEYVYENINNVYMGDIDAYINNIAE